MKTKQQYYMKWEASQPYKRIETFKIESLELEKSS